MESLEAEDTAFYAELTRQILMLMDDDDETHEKGGLGFQRRPLVGVMEAGNYFSWWEGGRSLEVPSWMERLWASKVGGTGVFIPRVVADVKSRRRRRHNKPRKNNFNVEGGRIHSSSGQKILC